MWPLIVWWKSQCHLAVEVQHRLSTLVPVTQWGPVSFLSAPAGLLHQTASCKAMCSIWDPIKPCKMSSKDIPLKKGPCEASQFLCLSTVIPSGCSFLTWGLSPDADVLLHSTVRWREFVSSLRAGWCLQSAVRLSGDSFLSWKVSTGKFTTFCSKWLCLVLFCSPLSLAVSCPTLFFSSCEQIAELLQTPSSRSSSLYLSDISKVPVGRHSSEHRSNQHLKNFESWAAVSLC